MGAVGAGLAGEGDPERAQRQKRDRWREWGVGGGDGTSDLREWVGWGE